MERTARTALINALRRAASAENANPGVEAWDLPEAADARRLTEAAGMSWDFASWSDAYYCAMTGMLGGVSTERDPSVRDLATPELIAQADRDLSPAHAAALLGEPASTAEQADERIREELAAALDHEFPRNGL